jgi:hypothetical protein
MCGVHGNFDREFGSTVRANPAPANKSFRSLSFYPARKPRQPVQSKQAMPSGQRHGERRLKGGEI